MNTYVVLSHQYGGKDAGESQRRDRILADSVILRHDDPEVVVVFDDEEGRIIGIVRDFDAVYLESSVQLAGTESQE